MVKNHYIKSKQTAASKREKCQACLSISERERWRAILRAIERGNVYCLNEMNNMAQRGVKKHPNLQFTKFTF